MQTFADWLRYYNDLDVAPGLEALEEMRALYKAKGMDILICGQPSRSELILSLERNSQIYFAFAFPITTDKHAFSFVQI